MIKDLVFKDVHNFRYERKFYITAATKEELEIYLKMHTALFREIYHERRVNNIYLDSFNLHHYFDAVDGASKRLKVRIRWYGDLFGLVEKPALEVKLKHNMHVGKISYALEPFMLDRRFSIATLRELFKKSAVSNIVRLHLMESNPTILNTYRRRYFLSANQKYRVTLDSDMEVFRLSPYENSFLSKTMKNDAIILEIKYNKADDEFIDNITNHFPFRVTRSSKYVSGVSELSII